LNTLDLTQASIRVLAFEHALEAAADKSLRILREADHLALEVGPWATPDLVGHVSYREIGESYDWRELAKRVAYCDPDSEWWQLATALPAASMERVGEVEVCGRTGNARRYIPRVVENAR